MGESVRIASEQAKMAQEVLAERIEVSLRYISDLKKGVVGITYGCESVGPDKK